MVEEQPLGVVRRVQAGDDVISDHELAVVADQLRERTSLPEPVVRRMLFAAKPHQPDGEACALCLVNLGVRPISKVIRTASGAEFPKRVHSKPRQVVVELRREGSFDLDPSAPLPKVAALTWRFCGLCLRAVFSADESTDGQSAPHPEGET